MSKKKPIVTRQFLLDLADDIYDRESGRFLRLCRGTLQNGPDPKDPKRPMHCGLGELYYAITRRHPNTVSGIDEDSVVQLALDESSLIVGNERAIRDAEKLISKLPAFIADKIYVDAGPTDDPNVDVFKHLLRSIAEVNDNNCGGPAACDTYDAFRSRASKVATVLRKAARLLPW